MKLVNKGVWSELLQCCVLSLIYNWRTRSGYLVLPAFHCTDMAGAIAIFERIDPQVKTIVTIAGDEFDTRYERSADADEWLSYRAAPRTKAEGVLCISTT